MENTSIASTLLAPCYLLTWSSGDYASNVLATELHLRREEKRRGKAPTPPSQGKAGSGTRARRPNRSCALWEHRTSTVLVSGPFGADIKPVIPSRLALAGRVIPSTRNRANGRITAAAGNANACTVSTAQREERHAGA